MRPQFTLGGLRLRTGELIKGKGDGRKPAKAGEPLRFAENRPLALKNHVSPGEKLSSGAPCVQEMTLMLACLKAQDYSESLCNAEINNFKKCAQAARALKLSPGEGRKDPTKKFEYTGKEINAMFSKYSPKS